MDEKRKSRYDSSSSSASSDDEIERKPKRVVNAAQGEPSKPTVQSYKPAHYVGILEERRCTDIPFLLLFTAFWGGMAVIAWYGYTRADLKRLEYGLDMEGNTCGTHNTQYNGSAGPDFTHRQYLYWLSPNEFLMDASSDGYKAVCLATCPTNTSTYVCEYKGANWDTNYYPNLGSNEKTSSQAGKINGEAIAQKFTKEVTLPSWMDPSSNDKKIFLCVGYAMCGITGLFLLFTLVIARRLKVAIACIKVASNAIGRMPSLLLFPLLPFFMVIMLLAWWLSVAVLLFTTSTVKKRADGSFKLVWSHTTQYLAAYHIFGLLWSWQFICGFSYLTISSSVAYYYWYQGDPPDKSSILSSIHRTSRYHLGTVAFGSLLVAVVQLVKFIFAYINSKLKRLRKSAWVPFCLIGCIGGCLFVLERILKYINRNAYIMVAIKGTNYCKSASRGVSLLVSNALRVIAVTVVGDIVIFLGKLLVGAGSGVCAFYMAGSKMYTDPEKSTYLSSPILPVLLSSIIGFLLGHIFMQVYEMAIDTVFLCFCEDCEQHDANPVCAPDTLLHAVGASRKI